MKYSVYLKTLAWGMLLASCADEFDQTYSVAVPQSVAEYAYLSEYAPLKDCVDRTKNADFKMGGALDVSSFNAGGVVYALAASNFDEIVAGNAMKMASCVSDDGTMDFSKVQNFVSNADAAGLSVYGHTLAWHSQQPKTYLESLLADKPVEAKGDNPALCNYSAAAGTNAWDYSVNYSLETPLVTGTSYTLSMTAKAETATSVYFWPNDGSNTQYLDVFTAPTSDATLTWNFTANYDLTTLQFCFGALEGKLYFDDIELKAVGSDENLIKNGTFDDDDLSMWSKASWLSNTFSIECPAAAATLTWWENIIVNGDCEGTDASCFVSKVDRGDMVPSEFTAGAGVDGTSGIKFEATAMTEYSWDNQFFITVPETFQSGDVIKFSVDVKADKEATISTQAHAGAGNYVHWAFVGSINFTTEWTTHTFAGAVPGDNVSTVALNLNDFADANTYYFDNISWSVERTSTSGGIPQTDQEKKDTLTYAMNRWISGMMKACDGKVVAWDVVNEALSGADYDGDGFYDLQHASNVSSDDQESGFYWQDYLGDIDYVRIAVSSARRNFAANGGNPSDLKLFINDYNLESTWDDNKKLKSLINWIGKWENDTVKIDGIGSQMHISCYADASKQASAEEHIVKMLNLMAESGKLVRISELDMGYIDEFGDALLTEELTEEQHKQMAAFYQFIVEKYFEIVPVAQQYGITQWCLTDSPSDSSWRKGQPTGLWDTNYNRKHTYGGFAEGLLKSGR